MHAPPQEEASVPSKERCCRHFAKFRLSSAATLLFPSLLCQALWVQLSDNCSTKITRSFDIFEFALRIIKQHLGLNKSSSLLTRANIPTRNNCSGLGDSPLGKVLAVKLRTVSSIPSPYRESQI